MQVRDLGPLVLIVEGRSIEFGVTKSAALLSRLAMSPQRYVSSDELIEAAWGVDAVVSAASLHSQLWRLRNLLEPERRQAPSVITKVGDGYRLTIGPDLIDSARFEQLVATVDSAVTARQSPHQTLQLIDEALALWRGQPFEALPEVAVALPARTRLSELRRQLEERRIEQLIALDQLDKVLADLEPLIADAPYREKLWAHRIRSLAVLGRTEESLASFQQVRRLLQDDLGLDPGPELQQLQSQILTGALPGSPSASPAEPSIKVADPTPRSLRPKLPRRSTPLVGRDTDLSRLITLVGHQPLVTVTGPGGCGKTRLTIEVAATVASSFPDGVWFVDLTAVTDPKAVADVVTTTLGLEASPIADPLDRIAGFVEGKKLLIVLDNCEHVIDGVAPCAATIVEGAAGQGRVVLATSREPLAVDGEIIWSLAPLSLVTATDDPGAASAAAALFIERARAAAPMRELSAADLTTVEQICNDVDGLPLAIELAAARLRFSSLSGIAEQTRTDPSRLAKIGRRPADHRESLYQAIEWSYRLLRPAEQTLHRCLSVLPGDFTLATAAGVSSVVGADQHATADSLIELANSSMVVVNRHPGRLHSTSFSQLATVRAHALRRLVDHRELEAVAGRRDEWVRDLLRRRPRLGRPEESGWYDEVDDAYGAVRAALEDATRPDGDAELVRLGHDLAFYWYYRSRVIEGSRWAQQAATHGPPPRTPVEAATRRLRLAATHFLRTRLDLALPQLSAGLEDVVEVPEDLTTEVAELLVGVGSAAWGCEAYDIMQDLHRRIQPLTERAEDPDLDILTATLGCVSTILSRPLEETEETARHIFETADRLRNEFAQWMAALVLTGIATAREDPAMGVYWTQQLAPIHLRIGTGGTSVFMESLGNYAAMAGDFPEAARMYAAGTTLARRAGAIWPNRPQTEAFMARTSSSLTQADFDRAWDAGRRVTLADVVRDWASHETT